jgi:glucose/arabinose dehydrogenase
MAIVAVLALAACTATGTPSPTLHNDPGFQLPTLRPLPSGPGFDPAAVNVSLEPFAHVPGGPLAIAAPDDGSGRLFVAAQDGRAWVIDRDGSTKATPLLDIRSLITTGGERGLLGIAPHPGFARDPRVFVDYTDLQGNTVLASYRISPGDPDRLDPASVVHVLGQAQPFPNHNGGALAFGPEGDLYVSFGDGGGAGDPQANGQSLASLLGKILRIDVDVPAGSAQPYAIPAGNPSNGSGGVRAEIWLYGLRNPWRMSFDRGTGDLWIGDVGQGAWEEVDVARAGQGGLNFGWNRMEGAHCYKPSTGCDPSGLTMPIAEYSHADGCVVIGGDVYRGSRYPMLAGAYLFLDYCSGRIWALDAERAQPSATLTPPVQVGMTDGQAAAFGEDQAGELYVASLSGGILRVVATPR